MPNLKQVIAGKHLFYPSHISKDLWLDAGGIVDLDNQVVAECVHGQEYKLEDVPAPGKGKRWPDPDPITHPAMIRLIKRTAEVSSQRSAQIAAEVTLKATGEPKAHGIPAPDLLPMESR